MGGSSARRNSRTAAIALAALILYPIAVTMPMLTVQQLGHAHASSILQGVVTLLSDGQIIVGIVVLLCSVILPLGKLIALLIMSLLGSRLAHSHRALTYRVIEFTGRWGMLDVLAVAVLVAALKLGNVMDVTPGPAALAFTVCVVLSLLATASFDPHSVWDDDGRLKPQMNADERR
jgi:paraquat-inducible protein A